MAAFLQFLRFFNWKTDGKWKMHSLGSYWARFAKWQSAYPTLPTSRLGSPTRKGSWHSLSVTGAPLRPAQIFVFALVLVRVGARKTKTAIRVSRRHEGDDGAAQGHRRNNSSHRRYVATKGKRAESSFQYEFHLPGDPRDCLVGI